MAKRKATPAGNTEADQSAVTNTNVEPMVIALAEQLGTFLGRVQAKADGWMENEALRQQVTQIRDSATTLLNQVNQSASAARKSASKAVASVRPKPKPERKEEAPVKAKARSGGTVDAPGKKHRKPPPQQKVDRRGSEPGKPMGQAGAKGRMRRGRG